MVNRFKILLSEYPHQFWTLFWGTLIFSAGNGLIFPFLSLYLNGTLSFSMTEVGVMYVTVAVITAVSQIVGGTLVDRIGRKPVMVFGLIGGVIPTVAMGFSGDILIGATGPTRLLVVAILVILFGLTGGVYGPAASAMVADLVESEKRTKAYSLLRIVQNIGIALGPAVGGFIATRSYLVLFLCAALGSLVYGILAVILVRETLPNLEPESKSMPPSQSTDGGYTAIFMDRIFITFCILYLVSILIYAQMNTTLPVYLKQSFGVKESEYGLLMSLNAVMVVFFQFPLSSWINRYEKGNMMAVGVLLFAIGFGMFAFVAAMPLFFLAQAIWTTGEMVTTPISQAFAADIAPNSMRGRYLGFYSLIWGIASGIGPLLGGLVMDHMGGKYIWYAAILFNTLVMFGFFLFNRRMKSAAAQTSPGSLSESPL
jgi:MFS family permease